MAAGSSTGYIRIAPRRLPDDGSCADHTRSTEPPIPAPVRSSPSILPCFFPPLAPTGVPQVYVIRVAVERKKKEEKKIKKFTEGVPTT